MADTAADLVEKEGIILVMGVTGVGKSSFINQLQPGSVVVGHTMESSKYGYPRSAQKNMTSIPFK